MEPIKRFVSTRLQLSSDCRIFDSSFVGLGGFSVETGGSIYKNSSVSLSILDSFFQKCSAKEYGGSIASYGGYFEYHRSCAENCLILQSTDNKWGNHIIASNAESIVLTSNSAFRCGPKMEECSDSAVCVGAKDLKIHTLNHSHCDSTGGCGAFAFVSKTVGSARYIIVYKGNDWHIVCDQSISEVDVDQMIAFGINCKSTMFYINSKGTLTIKNSCIFPGVHNDLVNNVPNLKIINCYANFSNDLFTKLSPSVSDPFFFRGHCNNKIKNKKILILPKNLVLLSIGLKIMLAN